MAFPVVPKSLHLQRYRACNIEMAVAIGSLAHHVSRWHCQYRACQFSCINNKQTRMHKQLFLVRTMYKTSCASVNALHPCCIARSTTGESFRASSLSLGASPSSPLLSLMARASASKALKQKFRLWPCALRRSLRWVPPPSWICHTGQPQPSALLPPQCPRRGALGCRCLHCLPNPFCP